MARLKNPAELLPGTMDAFQTLNQAMEKGGVPGTTRALVHMRASQINGCHVCQTAGTWQLQNAGESQERLNSIATWREADCFTAAERAALALAESVTRIADADNPVPDDIWEEAARHYDEGALATLLLSISVTNVYNRFNVATRQENVAW